MTISEIKNILNADLFCGENFLFREIKSAFASDFMSDVLAFATDQELLLTGMVNPQVVRTAQMMDIKCIIFVRGKKPTDEIIELARANDMVIMSCPDIMYNCCGQLYQAGLRG